MLSIRSISSSVTFMANLRTSSTKAVFGPFSSSAPPSTASLAFLRQGQGGDGVLAHGLLVAFIQLRVAVLDDLPHADLGEFLRHKLRIEQAALDHGLVPGRRPR